ncbi:MAG: dipeptide epimerase [Pseudomonadota bacterium]
MDPKIDRGELTARFEQVDYRYQQPFAITGYVFEVSSTVRVTLTRDDFTGHGEGQGVYYLGDDATSILKQLDGVSSDLPHIRALDDIQELLPPGGARNALDCAYWDLRTKEEGLSIWSLLDIQPAPLTTVYTLGINEPEIMAQQASAATKYPSLKLKLSGDRPIERVEAVREARPDAAIIVDVNQGWSFEELKEYAPRMKRLGVAMLEQPLARGGDESLASYTSPVPVGADESCLHSGDFTIAAQRYDLINIKLDKTGGLTEALKLARMTRDRGMGLMVGNMGGSSLAMAPSSVIGQMCNFVDIDGPLLLSSDCEHPLVYEEGGIVSLPSRSLWG